MPPKVCVLLKITVLQVTLHHLESSLAFGLQWRQQLSALQMEVAEKSEFKCSISCISISRSHIQLLAACQVRVSNYSGFKAREG